MNPSTDWQTALITLAAGALIGIIAIFVMRRRKNVEPEMDSDSVEAAAARPALRGFVWGVLSAVALGGIVYYATTVAHASSRAASWGAAPDTWRSACCPRRSRAAAALLRRSPPEMSCARTRRPRVRDFLRPRATTETEKKNEEER